MAKFIMVLNDGETFTDIDGCYIMEIPDDAEIEEIEEMIADDNVTELVAATFRVKDGAIKINMQNRYPLIVDQTR